MSFVSRLFAREFTIRLHGRDFGETRAREGVCNESNTPGASAMSAGIAARPTSYVFDFGGPIEFELPEPVSLNTHLGESAPTTELWCLHCERSFELRALRTDAGRARCAYYDCSGEAPDFWSWRAFRAFADGAPSRPEPGLRYPLAA
jgi:hypothetical protein